MKKIVLVSILILAGLASYWMVNSTTVFTSSVPTNYQECAKTRGSKYNKVSCSIFYQYPHKNVSDCISLGGCDPSAADGPSGCEIGFFNQNFTYPENVDECIDLAKGRKSSSERSISDLSSGGIKECWIFLNSVCRGDQATVENVMSSCPSNYKYKEHDYGHTFVRICENTFR